MKILPILAVTTGAVVALTACGGGGGHSAGAATTTPTPSSGGAFRAGPPGTSGLIAAVDGNTLQVQNPIAGQVAVDLTSATTYTQAVATTLSAVTVGTCVVATQPAATSGTASTAPTAPPTGPRTITADTVVVTAAASTGTCNAAFGGRGGGFATRTGAPPSGFPTGAGTGARAARSFGDVVTGKVLAITGSAITVQAQQRTPTSTSTTTVTDTVNVTSSTRYTHNVTASRAAVKVGLCINATGTAAADGTITAARVALSSPGASGCTAGFGRFGGVGAAAGGTGGQ